MPRSAFHSVAFFAAAVLVPAVTNGQFSQGSPSRYGTTAPRVASSTQQYHQQWPQGVVPGTGKLLDKAFDNFEDQDWSYEYQLPKSSHEQDNQRRYPLGYSKNGLWKESAKRGTPDHIVRVETPPGGIPGSTGALKIQSLNTGVPGVTSREPQQDDLILNVGAKYGSISASRTPSTVVRVWLPPYEQWEARSGSHFGIRLALGTTKVTQTKRFIFTKTEEEAEAYWPGFFIQYTRKADGHPHDGAMFLIRGGNNGGDFAGPVISQTGWWTVGMTVNPNGSVSFYAKPGVENLTGADHIATTLPYGYQAERFSTLFFNITSANDGRTWSTPFVIDDPQVYVLR
ncbi:MAG: hypothetical protein M3552_02325 [Planctomycetota bacterium]|nr:hypothetical protein [Planctomycetaceae bacterium]MDQ3329482.1 hypothetical protein [Planctomycetota bacterium]